METSEGKELSFMSYKSAIDINFWYILREKKLEEYKLNEEIITIHAQILNQFKNKMAPFCSVNEKAFLPLSNTVGCTTLITRLKIFNKKKEFMEMEIKEMEKKVLDKVIKDISSEEILNNILLLNPVYLFCYPDLKKYEFYYQFLFPILCLENQALASISSIQTMDNLFDDEETNIIQEHINVMYNSNNSTNQFSPFFIFLNDSKNNIKISDISELKEVYLNDSSSTKRYIGFIDPSFENEKPSYLLNNLLIYLGIKGIKQVDVLRIRRQNNSKIQKWSNAIQLNITNITNVKDIKLKGWENNRFQIKKVNLNSNMNPLSQATASVSLNLKLMKWNAEPNINLDIIRSCKCLLLGSGTLGNHVALNLLAWNVNNITFVDNGKVSFSNPVRQPLFKFEDCINGGKEKATTAAENLKLIYPEVNAKGYKIDIPMPGHVVTQVEEKEVIEQVELLESLIKENDAIFMLTDSRESRWLPTMLANKHNKLLINAALGFDSYTVLRHGMKDNNNENTLSCYFCSDVVAPRDSITDRSLDEQCTVTRPGLAPIAAANAVELLVSILQHPQHGLALPPDFNKSDETNNGEVNNRLATTIPHRINGYLANYKQILTYGTPFDRCTGCSKYVVEAYNKNGIEFLFKVFNNSQILQEITGIQGSLLDTLTWSGSDDDLDENDEF
ncbi:hypothetical protein K502DRAFT_362795 [Neoconidiobolus thromboides FSU 785]|nr:hypothetical protein K502DRAFT_362795 [Neoconidiobolus thromboides FSU 785]